MAASIKDKDWMQLEQAYNIFILDKKILITVTSEAENVHTWIQKVESRNQANRFRLIVGLEIKLGTSLRPVSLVVLCVYRSCLVFELANATQIPLALTQFFSNRDNTFVGVDIESKLVRLRREYDFRGCPRYVDLGDLAAEKYNRPELGSARLSDLRKFLHGSDLERRVVDDNWDQDEVLDEHVHSACIDAYACYELGSFLVYPIRRGTAD